MSLQRKKQSGRIRKRSTHYHRRLIMGRAPEGRHLLVQGARKRADIAMRKDSSSPTEQQPFISLLLLGSGLVLAFICILMTALTIRLLLG